MKANIRRSIIEDLPRLTEIYNQAISAGYCTCDTEMYNPKQREGWFQEHNNNLYPLFTCEVGDDIVGYAYLSAYRPGRAAVRHVAEISYYLDFSWHGKGIGSSLIEYMLKEAYARDITVLLAILLSCNDESISLLKKYGFTEWGCLPGIAIINGKGNNHLYYGKKFNIP